MSLQLSAANQKDTKWQCDKHQPIHYNECSGLYRSQGIIEILTLEILSLGMAVRCWVPSDVMALQPHPAIHGGPYSAGAQVLHQDLGLSNFSSQDSCGFKAFQKTLLRGSNAKTIDRDPRAERRVRKQKNKFGIEWHITNHVVPLLDFTDAEMRS